MPNFLIHNDTISQSGSKMEQCNSLLPRHPCPFCCHLPWFMVVEKCHQFNQYLWCHTIDAKRRKSQKSQVRHRREKRNLDTLYDGQVNSNRLSAQTMGTPNCHEVHYYWHWNFDIIATVICTFGSSPRPTVVLLSDCWPSRSSSSTTWWRTSLLSGCGWTQSMSSAGERWQVIWGWRWEEKLDINTRLISTLYQVGLFLAAYATISDESGETIIPIRAIMRM